MARNKEIFLRKEGEDPAFDVMASAHSHLLELAETLDRTLPFNIDSRMQGVNWVTERQRQFELVEHTVHDAEHSNTLVLS